MTAFVNGEKVYKYDDHFKIISHESIQVDKCPFCQMYMKKLPYEKDSLFLMCNNLECVRSFMANAQACLHRYSETSLFPVSFYLKTRNMRHFFSADLDDLEGINPHLRYGWERIKTSKCKGMLLTADVGVGKTHALICMAKDALKINFRNPDFTKSLRITSEVKYLSDLKSTYGKNSKLEEQDVIESHRDASMLFYDDIGSAEKSHDSTWGPEKIFEIIDYRYANDLPMLISTNLSFNELYKKLGKRTTDRLRTLVNVVIDGESRRGK